MDRSFYGSEAESRLIEELHQVLVERIDQVNQQWDTGKCDDSAEVPTADFVGIQYAPWYPDERYTADAAGWRAGSQQAAEAGLGQGWHWTIRDVQFLPRSTSETIAVYTVVHHWKDSSAPPGEAVFLETWVRQDRAWVLKRHTAEKR